MMTVETAETRSGEYDLYTSYLLCYVQVVGFLIVIKQLLLFILPATRSTQIGVWG